jgi:uncharacterized membrane protein YkvA (DUF1232 family)
MADPWRRGMAGARHFGARIVDPQGGYGAKLALLIGLAYPLGPVDLIPNRLPYIGYADQLAFVLGGTALAALLVHRESVAAARAGGAAPRRQLCPAAWLRAMVLDMVAMLFAAPLLRLATGAWPAGAEVAAFRRAFRHFTPLPPLLRAVAAVPAGREQLTRAMLAGWLQADASYRARLCAEAAHADAPEPGAGNSLSVWSGPNVTFLHLEKTAGMSVVAALSAHFHPLQIDADLRRAFPPHVLTPLPPFLVPRLRRCALVWGHYDLPSIRRLGEGRFTFTFLRDPASRIVSLYRYWRAQAARDLGWNGMNQPVLAAQRLTLVEFLESDDPWILDYIDNFYVRRLTGRYALGQAADPLAGDPEGLLRAALLALDAFDFIGLTERTGESLARLGGRLGFPPPAQPPRVNVTRQDREAGLDDPAVRKALARLTRLDRVIYDAAVARFHAGP